MLVYRLLQWEWNECYILWVCVWGLRYPQCTAYVPYFYLWSVWLYNIFPLNLINRTTLGKKLFNTKCVFSQHHLLGTFIILRIAERDMIKSVQCTVHSAQCTPVCMYSAAIVKFVFSADFLKLLKYETSWKSVSPVGVQLFSADRRTWRS